MINEVQRITTFFSTIVLVSAFGLAVSIGSAGIAGAKAPLTSCYTCWQADMAAARTLAKTPPKIAGHRHAAPQHG
jgi:hypothetical protein